MKTKFIFLFYFLFPLLFSQLQAQETTSTAGGNINGASGSISYTVGQVASLYLSQSNGSVAQGVQQPYEIFLITGIDEANGISLDIQVYPNPVQDFIKLRIKGLNTENLLWQIHDSSGKLLESDHISGTESLISMSRYAAGIYLFSVVNKNNLQYKTFQIIKN